MGGVEPRLSVWCIEEKGPAKKEGGWIAPRFRLKDHETLLVYAGLVLGLSTHIFYRNESIFGLKTSRPVNLSGGGRSIVRGTL